MRRLLAAVFIAAIGLSAPAWAQKSKGVGQGPTTCDEVATALSGLATIDISTIEAIDNGCRATDLVFDFGNGYSRFLFAEVIVTAPDLFTRWGEQRLPDAVELTAKGIQFAPQTGNPSTDYVIGVQQMPYDVHLQYRWDEAAAQLILVDASMTSDTLGRVAVSGVIAGVARMPAASDGMEDIAGYGIAQASISLANRAILENFVIPTLVAMLSGSADPQPQIEALQAMLRATITALPEDIADAASRAALIDFVNAFPHPRQIYELTLTAEPPIPVTELKTIDGITAGAALLGRVKVVAAHLQPLPPTP